MEKEFNLSSWIVEKDIIGQDKKIGYIHESAVKHFIEILKEELECGSVCYDDDLIINVDYITDLIDKFAGERLI